MCKCCCQLLLALLLCLHSDPAKDHNWVQLAQGLFGLMTDPHDRMPCTHNAYLKLCQLQRPVLTKWVNGAGKVPYDVILVDEAQVRGVLGFW